MKRVIVVGCGHGGLTAAARLSLNGYDVTVLENHRREELGYDWDDSVGKNCFESAGLPYPGDEFFFQADRMCYYNPQKTVRVVPDGKASTTYGYIDRKFLINYLIDYAIKCGVRISFETEVISSVCSENRVEGIRCRKDFTEHLIYTDMIIDAAGICSPVKLSLPDRFNIKNKVDSDEVFYGWRGYFDKTDNIITDPESNIYFFHCNHVGMDWAITKDGYVDVLVGGFGSLSEENIENALSDFRKDYPYIGDKLLRGGYCDKIPLGKSLSVFVCNGYAAVGNSAYMTEPLSGSGIDLSIYAGRLLADTIIESGGDFSVESLWKYNYTYIKTQSEKRYMSSIIKSLMSVLDGQDIDFLMEKGIMAQKEIAGTGGDYTFSQLMQKLNVIRRPKLFKPLSQMLTKIILSEKLKRDIPEIYDREAVERWSKEYSKL